MKLSYPKLITLIFFPFLVLLSCTQPSTPSEDWPMYSSDQTGSKYSPLAQINSDNAQSLEVAWVYRTGDMRVKPAT
ncbi:MAG: hypothetical protein KDE26_25065, partial [Bacteroidetes bacterium]|nr:hypothetical protein [Bacteroidota bacterium]